MTNSNYKPILYLLMFNMFITMGGIGMIVPVMPAYLEVFGARGQIYGFLIATFSFSQFLFYPLSGIIHIAMVVKILFANLSVQYII